MQPFGKSGHISQNITWKDPSILIVAVRIKLGISVRSNFVGLEIQIVPLYFHEIVHAGGIPLGQNQFLSMCLRGRKGFLPSLNTTKTSFRIHDFRSAENLLHLGKMGETTKCDWVDIDVRPLNRAAASRKEHSSVAADDDLLVGILEILERQVILLEIIDAWRENDLYVILSLERLRNTGRKPVKIGMGLHKDGRKKKNQANLHGSGS